MSEAPTLTAWLEPTGLVDETQFTPWADEGWLSWNGQSPEMAVCGFVQTLISMMKPYQVLETGVGQGYMTRAIVGALEDAALCAYESDNDWREALWSLPFWNDNDAVLSSHPSPSIEAIELSTLCVFDSDFAYRFNEVRDWSRYAKPGAVAIIHDTSDRPDTIHQSLRELITDLGITGTFLNNPRGCFMAVQGRRDHGRDEESAGEEGPR